MKKADLIFQLIIGCAVLLVIFTADLEIRDIWLLSFLYTIQYKLVSIDAEIKKRNGNIDD